MQHMLTKKDLSQDRWIYEIMDRQTNGQTGKYTGRHSDIQKDGQTGIQPVLKIDKWQQTERILDRQTGVHAYRQTDKNTDCERQTDRYISTDNGYTNIQT